MCETPFFICFSGVCGYAALERLTIAHFSIWICALDDLRAAQFAQVVLYGPNGESRVFRNECRNDGLGLAEAVPVINPRRPSWSRCGAFMRQGSPAPAAWRQAVAMQLGGLKRKADAPWA